MDEARATSPTTGIGRISVLVTVLVPVLASVQVVLAACGSDDPAPVLQQSQYPRGLQRILADRPAPTHDVFQVFVCKVPVNTTDPTFGDLTLRLPLTPDDVATRMEDHVRPYFEALSYSRYHPSFTSGETVTMTGTETHTQCAERAVDASAADAAAVMVVADAEIVDTAAGGWGRPGAACASDFCPATETRRAFFVGASDFHPDWGPVPLLDLIEHEIGHTLGLPHSGNGARAEDQHASALDVMSNSAAPREISEGELPEGNAQPDRKNGQDTLAINRLSLGWLPVDDIAVVAPQGGRFDLSSSAGSDGLRLVVLPIDDESFLTVEYLAAVGFDDFLPASGIAVHRIDQAPAACDRPADDDRPCTGIDRAQITLGSESPHLDLLDEVGESWQLDGWTITLRSTDPAERGARSASDQPEGGSSRSEAEASPDPLVLQVEVRPTER